MKAIYLVMSQTGTWLSKVIKAYTKEEYNHISISLEGTLNPMYSFGRVKPSNPFSGGFALENLSEGVYKIFPQCKCKIYKLEVSSYQYNKLRRLLVDFESNKNRYRYNFLGLFFIALNVDRQREDHYFCAQFVAEILQESGIYNFRKPSNLVTVRDFMDIPHMHPIFEGYMSSILESAII